MEWHDEKVVEARVRLIHTRSIEGLDVWKRLNHSLGCEKVRSSQRSPQLTGSSLGTISDFHAEVVLHNLSLRAVSKPTRRLSDR